MPPIRPAAIARAKRYPADEGPRASTLACSGSQHEPRDEQDKGELRQGDGRHPHLSVQVGDDRVRLGQEPGLGDHHRECGEVEGLREGEGRDAEEHDPNVGRGPYRSIARATRDMAAA